MINVGKGKAFLAAVAALAAFLLIAGCLRDGSRANQAPNMTVDASALAPGDYEFKTIHDGRERMYLMHVPPSYKNDTPAPAVIYLHGGGGGIESSQKDGMYDYSDKFGFILLSPAGSGALAADRLLTWNAGSWGPADNESCCGYAAEHDIDDAGFISQMIDETEGRLNVDAKRIYATGISNGGIMSYRLACELSGKIAAVAPVAPPGLESNCAPSRPVSVMHVHGTGDPCANYSGGLSGGCVGIRKYYMLPAQHDVDFWLRENGCSGNGSISYHKGNASCTSYSCAQGSEVEFCTIIGGGHTWPGGWQYLPAAWVGPVSYDISFEQIWEFFQRNPINE